MKVKKVQSKINEINFDLELLKHWKSLSIKAKLDWLESALRFGKLRKF